MHDAWWLFYGVLTAMMLVLAVGAGHYAQAWNLRMSGCILAALYLLTNLSRQVGVLHMLPYPFLDVIAMTWFILVLVDERCIWQGLLCALFGLDLGLHGIFFYLGDYRSPSVYTYDLCLNLIYIAQMATVAVPSARLLYAYEIR